MSRWAVNSDEWYPVHDPFKPNYESPHHYELDDALVEAYIAARDEHKRWLDALDEAIDVEDRRRLALSEPKRNGHLMRAVLQDGTVLAEFWLTSGSSYHISFPTSVPEYYWACGVPR